MIPTPSISLSKVIIIPLACFRSAFAAAQEETERSSETVDGGCWGRLLQGLRKCDMTVVLGLLSAMFVDQRGGVSRPAFVGCMRALFEVR